MVVDKIAERMDPNTLLERLLRLEEKIEELKRENALLRQAQQAQAASKKGEETAAAASRPEAVAAAGTIRLSVDPATGQIVDASPAAVRFFGYGVEALRGRHIADLDLLSQKGAPLPTPGEAASLFRARYRLAQGEVRDADVFIYPIVREGQPLLQYTIFDVTERESDIRALRRSERRFRQIVEQAADLIYRTDPSGYITYINPAALRLFGYSLEELRRVHFSELIHPDYRAEILAFYARQASSRTPSTYCEFPIITQPGKVVWIGQSVQLFTRDERILGFQAIARDISERKQAEKLITDHVARLHRHNRRLHERLQKLERINIDLGGMAMTDYLTGLRNYRAFRDRLNHAFQHARNTRTPLSLLLIDLDHFKRVNDTRGHAAGDALLNTLGSLLQTRARSTDVVARYGGEEFAVILPFTDQSGAIAQAERLRAIIEHTFSNDGVTASIGVASLSETVHSPEDLIRQADIALYAAKQQRNAVRHYTQLTPETQQNILQIVTRQPAAEGTNVSEE